MRELPAFLEPAPSRPPRPRRAAGAPATAPRADGRRIPGEAGLWIFLFADMTIFAVFFAAFLLAADGAPAAFADGRAHLHAGAGALNTVLLLTSSLLVARAVAGHAAGRTHDARRLLLGAVGCGLAFATVKVAEWGVTLADGRTPASGDFPMFYFVITGVHFVHLLIGVTLLLLVRRRLARDAAAGRWLLVESGAAYWHMVDLLWLLIFPLLYLGSPS